MVAVVVPWRSGCRYREAAWGRVQELYAERHPDWEVIEALGPSGPWCKAAAVNPAVEAVDADVVIVADADVWCDALERAVYAVVCGRSRWSMPHRMVHRLNEVGTAALMAAQPYGCKEHYAQPPYEGLWGGGIVAAQREVLQDAHLDPRFESWGQEDQSWALALQTLHGKGWRGEADLVHLYHPPQDRETRQRGSREGWELYQRYRRARRDPERMRALLQEAA